MPESNVAEQEIYDPAPTPTTSSLDSDLDSDLEACKEEGGPATLLKICLLGYRSNPYSGGQGIYLRYLSKALQRAGHQVDVISGEPYPILDEGVRLI